MYLLFNYDNVTLKYYIYVYVLSVLYCYNRTLAQC